MKKSHILIVIPTKFLGNLLISLGVIQDASAKFDSLGQPYSILVDQSFEPLVANLFNSDSLIFYPRAFLKKSNFIAKSVAYLHLIGKIRGLRIDKAIDLEGDSVSRMLARLSGATTRIGPHECLRPNWYHQSSTPKLSPSEFYKYLNVMSCAIPLSNLSQQYGKLNIPEITDKDSLLAKLHLEFDQPKIVVLHAGASKTRKLWPNEKWISLVELLQKEGFSPVLIGAGNMDSVTNQSINEGLARPIPDLVNKLSLVELAQLLNRSCFYIGNDSGPMHMAAALDVPSIAIFGPTDESIWGPLVDTTTVMRGFQCPPECRNGHHCELGFCCLVNLSAADVFAKFKERISAL